MIFLLPGGGHKRMLQTRMADFGVMATPAGGHRPKLLTEVRCWAADNGCYSNRFDYGRWIGWLEALRPFRETCLFAVAPDVVGDWSATWERARPALPMMRTLGYRVAIVAQDGVMVESFPWGEADALFVGGTTGFKESALALNLVKGANARGLHSHVGRVNTRRRILMAYRMGADSVDGTALCHVPDFWFQTLVRWMGEANKQQILAGLLGE